MALQHRALLGERTAGLIFDAGDVLYDTTPGRRRLLRVLAQMGLHTQYACFFRIWERNFLREVYCGRQTYLEAFRALLRSFGFTEPQIDEVAVATNVHRRALEEPERLLPGVRETLARRELSHLSLGILTNATVPSVDIERQLPTLGLAGRFRWIFSSIDLGIAMPQRAAYCAAVEAMGLSPQQVAFVGHDSDELAGAASAGMTTVAINYCHGALANIYLDNFHQLASVVDHRAPVRLAG
jgi:putative hydrolase of the HAD superfamily